MSTFPCKGPLSRREFLRAGALAFGGLTLADVLAAQAASGNPAKEKSIILFWMWGGPSQFETWDPKPNAPSEYRGPLQPIHTNVPGIDICEVFPLQARIADKFSLIRSLHHTMSSHNDGSIEMLTGKTPKPDPTSTALSEHPDFGMVASKLRGLRSDGLPQYVGIPRQPFMTKPNYLGLSHKGYDSGDPSVKDYRPQNLTLSAGFNGSRLDDRKGLLRQFDAMRRRGDALTDIEGADRFQNVAFQMLTNRRTADAFDLAKEDPRLRDRYGRHLWGQSCLLARRLVEAGTSVVTIDALAPEMGKPVYFSWDDHAAAQMDWDIARGMKWRAPFMDQGLSALIDDIYQRGLDKDVLIIAMGEFGRTPRVTQSNSCLGRDHWPDSMSALVSGGGVKTGQVIGSTNSRGEYPKDRPLTPQDLLATMYRHLGIDYRQPFLDFTGRPIAILNDGEPISELS